MKLNAMRGTYPHAARLFRRWADMGEIDVRAVDGLSEAALQRIDDGTTPERDARLLLIARSQHIKRQG